MATLSKQGRCYHEFYSLKGRPGRLNDGEYVERCSACDCLPVGRDEETDEPYCDCCVVTEPPPLIDNRIGPNFGKPKLRTSPGLQTRR